jgi:hypothetical protein
MRTFQGPSPSAWRQMRTVNNDERGWMDKLACSIGLTSKSPQVMVVRRGESSIRSYIGRQSLTGEPDIVALLPLV